MMCSDNAVMVGRKFFMRYVLAVLYKLYIENCDRVRIRALGKNTSRAVHIANSALHLVRELAIDKVEIGTVAFSSEGRTRYVSMIDIELVKRDFIP